jgi:hypothetical protein
MKLVPLAITLAVSAHPGAEAAEVKSQPLQLRPKVAMAATLSHRYAPFVSPSSEPELELIPRRHARAESSRSSCAGERSLCYDAGSGRIVYKPARQLMPEIPGLQRENISIKRDRIVLRYSW